MKPAVRPWLVVVAAVLLVVAWFAFTEIQSFREDGAARVAAVTGFEAQSGLKNVEVVRSHVDGDCAVVDLHHRALKSGVLSVALAKVAGRWQVKRVDDDNPNTLGFDVDAAAGGVSCSDILAGADG
jgi:hypothetical protein